MEGRGMKLRLVSGTLGVMLGVGLLAFAPSALASASVTFGTPQLVGGGISLESIACESADTCLAVGYSSTPDSGQTDINSYVTPISDGVPGTPVAVPPVAMPTPGLATPGYRLELTDLVCASSSTCYAVGSYYPGNATLLNYGGGVVVTITNGVPSPPELIQSSAPAGWGPLDQLALTGISCWSIGGCEAIGTLTGVDSPAGTYTDYGVAASILNGVPQSVDADIGAHTFNSIECFAANACDILGVGQDSSYYDDDDGFLVGLNGSVFATPQADADLYDVTGSFACYSTTSCLIVGYGFVGDGFVSDGFYQTLTNNATIGPAVASAFPPGYYQESCPTTTVCWVVGAATIGGGTVAEPIVNGVAQPTTATNVGEVFAVACTTATSCLAIVQAPQGTSQAIISFTETTSNTPPTGPGSGSGSDSSSGSGSGSGSGSSSGSSASPQATVTKPTQKDGVTKIAIDCKDARCSLKLTETIKVKRNQKTKLETVASKAVALAAGKRAVESLKLNALGVKAMKETKDKRLQTTLTITLNGKRVSIKTLTLTGGDTTKA
jgi:hypothetical protein